MMGRITSGEADDSDSRKRRRRLAAAERAVEEWEAAHTKKGVVTYGLIDPVEAPCFDEIKKALRSCVTYDRRSEILTLHFRYPYQLDLATVCEPIHLLGWITHLLKKSWMTTKYAVAVIERVAEIRKWDVHPPASGLAYKTVKPKAGKKRPPGPRDSAWWEIMSQEADITISGVKLTYAQSMTVRVAIQSFAMSLHEILKDPPDACATEKAYLERIKELNELIGRTCA